MKTSTASCFKAAFAILFFTVVVASTGANAAFKSSQGIFRGVIGCAQKASEMDFENQVPLKCADAFFAKNISTLERQRFLSVLNKPFRVSGGHECPKLQTEKARRVKKDFQDVLCFDFNDGVSGRQLGFAFFATENDKTVISDLKIF